MCPALPWSRWSPAAFPVMGLPHEAFPPNKPQRSGRGAQQKQHMLPCNCYRAINHRFLHRRSDMVTYLSLCADDGVAGGCFLS